ADAAHPGEVHVGDPTLDLLHLDAVVPRSDAAQVRLDQRSEEGLLSARQLAETYPLVPEHEVVAKRRREHFARKACRTDGLLDLCRRQRTDQREALRLLRLKDAGAGIRAGVGRYWLRPHEHRRHHDLIAEDEAVHDQMMSVDLPSPRSV